MPSRPVGLGYLGAQVRDLDDPARASAAPRPGSRARRARPACSCRASPGASTIWSARPIAASASGHAGASAGTSSTRGGSRSGRARTATWPVDGVAADVGRQRRPGRSWPGARGRPRRASRPASSSAAAESPSVSASPTMHRGCRARGRRARRARSGARTRAGHGPVVGRRARRGTCGGRRARARRGRGAGGPSEPPSSATLTTAVISPAYSTRPRAARRRGRALRRARRLLGPPSSGVSHGRRPGGARAAR